MQPLTRHQQQTLKRERWALLNRLIRMSELPMLMLSFVWLALLIADLSRGLTPVQQWLADAIWLVFILDFALQLLIAPERRHYLRRNWLTGLAIVLPAFRVLRVFQLLRIMRLARLGTSVYFLRMLTSLRRTLSALNRVFGRRGFGYLFSLSVLVTFTGAAGMAHFESPAALARHGVSGAAGLAGYGDALWWTAMVMTTMGSDYWPKTSEGRLLGFLLAGYASIVYGYLTATIASYFIARDRGRDSAASADPARAD